jgi:FHA domain
MSTRAAVRPPTSPAPQPPPPTPIRERPAAVEEETGPLQPAAEERIIDSFRLLDHRTRGRATSERMARRGPHLAFQDATETRLIALDGKITHIGRSITSDVRIEDRGVSRSHAILVKHGRFARVLDNRSSNGTYVNGRRIVATNVQNGDVICVGSVAMQYLEID